MQRENQADASPIQGNNGELSPQEEIKAPMVESPLDMPPKRKPTFPWGALKTFIFIFLIGHGINWARFSLFSELASCGKIPEALAGEFELGTINRAQQAYFLENQIFVKDIETLKLGIKPNDKNFSYSIQTTNQAVFSYAIANSDAYKRRTEYFGPFWWDFKDSPPFKSSVGAVFAVPSNNINSKSKQKKMTTVSIVCNSLRPGSTTLITPKLIKSVPTCGALTKEGVR
jgi:type IV pilus assembly protein PilA